MTENDRNCRTLIVCFTLAIVALVPLRFVELGQSGVFTPKAPAVLGVTTEKQQVVLPNANVNQIEAPYNKQVGKCVLADDADKQLTKITVLMNKKGNTKSEQVNYAKEIQNIINSRCE